VSETTRRPLTGIRVLELSTAVAGPVAGCVLADMGAEVIKIEAPGARTAAQTRVPPPIEGAPDHPWNRVPLFNELHRGKRLLALNIGKPEGREIFLDLVAQSDVVLENFSPNTLKNLRIDEPVLRERRPDVILVSMPAFGKTGPYAERGSYGPGIDAMSGLSHLTGYPDRPPSKPAQFFCDQNAGVTAALATMAALRYRARTGKGQYIELSMLEGEIQVIAPALMDVIMNGHVPMRMGNRDARYAPQGVYRCAGDDRWLALCVEDDEQWRALARTIGRADLAEDPAFATAEARHVRHDEIDAAIERWTARRSDHEAMRALQAAGVPAGAVQDVADLHRDPHLAHRETLTFAQHPEMGRFPHTRTAWRSARGHHGVSGPGPVYADGRNLALRSILGLDEAAIERLLAARVIADRPAS
jgi:crotonobetainyl-CoA:carnitine CoA-transferase CaiB-like acyl-CoA transferase